MENRQLRNCTPDRPCLARGVFWLFKILERFLPVYPDDPIAGIAA